MLEYLLPPEVLLTALALDADTDVSGGVALAVFLL